MGYPVAFLLSNIPLRISNLLMILVLLPFWTSLLVRTSSWIVLLQEKGVVNEILVNLGLVDNANRLEIIHNSTGTIIAMTHILLPFMITALIQRNENHITLLYAGGTLHGGDGLYRFSPCVFSANRARHRRRGDFGLYFIHRLLHHPGTCRRHHRHFYLQPNRLPHQSSLDWGLGAALGSLLLVLVLILYWCYDRIVGIDNMKLVNTMVPPYVQGWEKYGTTPCASLSG